VANAGQLLPATSVSRAKEKKMHTAIDSIKENLSKKDKSDVQKKLEFP